MKIADKQLIVKQFGISVAELFDSGKDYPDSDLILFKELLFVSIIMVQLLVETG
jgi:hypothetical protein